MKNLFKVLGLLCLTHAAFAHNVAHQNSPFEFSVLVGGSYIPNTIEDQTLELMPYEIGPYADTFTNQSDAGAFTWGIDAKYRFPLHEPSVKHYIVDSIAVGVDLYQITNFEQTGDVLQFNMPEYKNYTYTLKLKNTRIMADSDLDFHPILPNFIPFIEAGIGAAITSIAYDSKPIPPLDSDDFTLPNKTTWSFAYQAGAGFKYIVHPHVILSLRYLYANMGNVDSSTSGSTTTLETPLTVNMSTQNLLFGLTLK